MKPTNETLRQAEAKRLNQSCSCVTLDRPTVAQDIAHQLGEDAEDILSSAAWHQLFSNVAVFAPNQDLARMQAMVRALEAATALPDYREKVLSWAPSTARLDPGPAGAFMGYDFHLGDDGPRLIEINTNAGGAFLNAVLVRAQRRCCGGATNGLWAEDFDHEVIRQFESEWHAQRGSRRLETIAIVDDQPEEQYLYPEFRLAQKLLQRGGIETHILSPKDFQLKNGVLYGNGKRIDLVYNRLVDFGLEAPEHAALRAAWSEGGAVITPNPHIHALFANKRNLAVLSDQTTLKEWGLSAENAELLRQGIPHTQMVNTNNAEELWNKRKQLFFKPVAGHGSKGVYKGSKLTKSTFARILESGYIAQAYVPPSERLVMVDDEREMLKVDVRLYTYRGELLLAAARLYRGQTTNFRTPGGGFAPVLLKQT